MSYRQIAGTTIEVPDWVQVPAFMEFSEEKRKKNVHAIRYIKRKYFGKPNTQNQHSGQGAHTTAATAQK